MDLEIRISAQSHIITGHGEYEHGKDTPLRECPFCDGSQLTVRNQANPLYWVECECGAKLYADIGLSGFCILSKIQCEYVHMLAFQAAIDKWNNKKC